MKLIPVFFCFLLLSTNLTAQDLVVKTDGSTAYLVHTVEPKENYYSIGRIYNISPRTYVPYNHLKLEAPMSIGQQVRIPLVEQNFTTNNTGTANEAFVPLYYVVQEKESLNKIGQLINVNAEALKKLNGLKSESVNKGDKLLIGYLKVLKEQSPLAARANVGKPVVKMVDPGTANNSVVKNEAPKAEPEVKTPEIKKDEKPVVKEVATPSTEKKQPATSAEEWKEGVFRTEYFLQTNNGSNTQSAEGQCGVFKSSSGWSNGKYYALMNGVERGTIVKIMVNGRAVYAKVLDAVPNVKENAGLNVLISNAAASRLEVNENKFNVGIMYAK
jgi:LysM repeat protein